MTPKTWQDLRGYITWFVLVTTISGGIAWASADFGNKQQSAYQQLHVELAAIRNRYHQTEQDAQLIARWLPDFEALQRRGFIAKEDRLAWINALHLATEHAQLPSLHYRLDKQREHSVGFAMLSDGLALRASEMTIEVGLLHEGDLMRLLGDLDLHTDALYQVQQCSLRRNQPQLQFQPPAENLAAVCTLLWITVMPRQPL